MTEVDCTNSLIMKEINNKIAEEVNEEFFCNGCVCDYCKLNEIFYTLGNLEEVKGMEE